MFQLLADPRLDAMTIVTSFCTARELRRMLPGVNFKIEFCATLADDVVKVSPALYDQFAAFLAYQTQ